MIKLSEIDRDYLNRMKGITEVKAIKSAISITEKFCKEMLAPLFLAGGFDRDEITSCVKAALITVIQTNPDDEFDVDDDVEEEDIPDEAEEIDELLDKLAKILKEKEQ